MLTATNLITKRAQLLRQIREFFYAKNVLEVDTQHLAITSTPDPQTASFRVNSKSTANTFDTTKPLYLQPSPEFFMKRLLCQNSGDIYQMAHVFRDEAKGNYHAQEFMLLEWYRLGFSMIDLINEVFELVELFLPAIPKQIISYQQLFSQYLAIDNIHLATTGQLADKYLSLKPVIIASNMSQDDWLNLMMAELIEPNLSGAVVVHSYPISQAALAKINNDAAQRFELYINGIEIANGFDELQDAKQQRQRFMAENQQRQQLGLETMPLDEDFLEALESGLPQCSGVALGVDRLLMVLLKVKSIQSVMLI